MISWWAIFSLCSSAKLRNNISKSKLLLWIYSHVYIANSTQFLNIIKSNPKHYSTLGPISAADAIFRINHSFRAYLLLDAVLIERRLSVIFLSWNFPWNAIAEAPLSLFCEFLRLYWHSLKLRTFTFVEYHPHVRLRMRTYLLMLYSTT